jgi:hypothetical protein
MRKCSIFDGLYALALTARKPIHTGPLTNSSTPILCSREEWAFATRETNFTRGTEPRISLFPVEKCAPS